MDLVQTGRAPEEIADGLAAAGQRVLDVPCDVANEACVAAAIHATVEQLVRREMAQESVVLMRGEECSAPDALSPAPGRAR